MNCIIVDDEPLARAEMEAVIDEISDVKVVGSFSNGRAVLHFLTSNKVDLVFLDIEMPMITGIELAAQLPISTMVIFTTAYSQYALKSYDLDAIDYLLKPIETLRLDRALKKAEIYRRLLSDHPENNTLAGHTEEFLLIKSDRKYHKIRFTDIKFIEGLKDYVVIHIGSSRLITAMNLKNFHQRIPKNLFLRISKSYIVNTKYVDSFDEHIIYVGEVELPLGEVYKKEFLLEYCKG